MYSAYPFGRVFKKILYRTVSMDRREQTVERKNHPSKFEATKRVCLYIHTVGCSMYRYIWLRKWSNEKES